MFTLEVRGAASKLRDVIIGLFVLGLILTLVFLHFRGYGPHANLQSSDAAYYSIMHANAKTLTIEFIAFGVAWWVVLAILVFALIRRRAILMGAAFGLLALSLSLMWIATLRPALATMRSVKSFIPIVVDHVKGDQLCIPSGINYELSYYYGAAVPELADPQCANVTAGRPVYLIATPRELDAMRPEYRARLKLIAKSNLIGGGGPPALYEISPSGANGDLKGGGAAAK